MPEALQKPGGRGVRTGVIHGSSRTPPVPGCRLRGYLCLCGDRFGLIVFTWFWGWIKFRGIGQWQVFTPISQVRKLRLREARKEPQPVVVPPAGRLRITTNFPEHEAKVNPISPPTPQPLVWLRFGDSWECGQVLELPGDPRLAGLPPTTQQLEESPQALRRPRCPPGGAQDCALKARRDGLFPRVSGCTEPGPAPPDAEAPAALEARLP